MISNIRSNTFKLRKVIIRMQYARICIDRRLTMSRLQDGVNPHFSRYTDAKDNNSIFVTRRKFTALAHSSVCSHFSHHYLCASAIPAPLLCRLGMSSLAGWKRLVENGNHARSGLSLALVRLRICKVFRCIHSTRNSSRALYHVTSFCTNCEQVQFK